MISYSIEKKEIRRFGIIAFLFFGALFGIAVYRNKELTTYFFGCLSFIGIALFILPEQLRPIYIGWVKLGRFIGKINTIVMLTLIYYIIITPMGLMKKIFEKNPQIPLKPDKKVLSYWVVRSEPLQPKERFYKGY